VPPVGGYGDPEKLYFYGLQNAPKQVKKEPQGAVLSRKNHSKQLVHVSIIFALFFTLPCRQKPMYSLRSVIYWLLFD
jgi:hypothetical protein